MAGMRAAVVHSFGQPLSIDQRPIPEPGTGQLLVRIVACGVCPTDLHAVNGDLPIRPSLPFVPGHEAVGHVAATGPGVKEFREGDRVGVAWLHDACGGCEYCLSCRECLCERQHNTGFNVDGGYAEYALAAADYVARLPDVADLIAMAPILCVGATTYKGLKETEARAGEWVAILGAGGPGHLAIQYARAMGFHVVAVDVVDAHLVLAARLGAEVTINAAYGDAAQVVRRATGGGAHGILVTTAAPSVSAQAVAMARRGGTIVLTSLSPGQFPVPISEVMLKRVTVRGAAVGTRAELAEAIAVAASREVRAAIDVEPLENVNAVLRSLATGQLDGHAVLSI